MKDFLARDTHASFVRALAQPLAFGFVLLILAGLFIFANHAQAAPRKGFEAMQVTAPKQGFVLTPEEVKQVTVSFQNIGTKTWKKTGRGYLSVYTQGPKYRTSEFQHEDWIDYTQAVILDENSVAPGEVGHFIMTLKAPKTKKQYKETFQLAAEDTTWVPGGEFTLIINVEDNQVVSTPGLQKEVEDGTASPISGDGLSAMILLRSEKNIVAKAGEIINYKVGVKNTGTVVWSKREIRSSDISIASTNTQHSSWVSSTKVVVNDAGSVKPGGLDFIKFKFTAPSTKGNHTVRYRLAANDELIPDFYIDIPVEVTTGAPAAIESPVIVSEDVAEADNLIDEPIVRIGVFTVDEETDWEVEISCNTTWKLRSGMGGLLGELKANEMVRGFYKNQRYYFNRGRGIEQTNDYLRFVPDSKDGVCTVENFDRRKTRRAGYADNQFRDVLELRYNSAKDRTWLINELPIEEYLYGLAETSNVSHHEFKKTLVTIARTYALYHWERATKHKDEYFHMNAYADDQVYKGYEYETRNPNIRKAVQDTVGTVVTYQGRTALTPYFSRSDGRTRDWGEVWGGTVEWVKSVPTPCDAERGFKLWGHGVGLSATEALCMAEKKAKKWDEILNYFYQGIELTKRWNKS